MCAGRHGFSHPLSGIGIKRETSFYSPVFLNCETYKLQIWRFFYNFAQTLSVIIMEFVRIIDGYDHLWAVKSPHEEVDELTLLFRSWNNGEFLFDFFMENFDDLKDFFRIERIEEAVSDTFDDADVLQELILDFPYTENLDELFKPLGLNDSRTRELSREKARNWNRNRHASWLRIYAIRLDPNVYVVTGGAIKLTRTMQERAHTMEQLDRLNRCKAYLKANGVFDRDSFVELI